MTEAQEQEQNYRTTDLALAALLHVEGFVSRCEARGREVWFIFRWTEELDKLVEDYHDGMSEVEPLTFIKAQKKCRKMIDGALGRGSGPNGRQ